MDLESIRQALAVADHRSFRRASLALGVQQSGISRRVKQLEHRLGVALFERRPGGVRVTSAGEPFLHATRRALRELETAAARAAAAGRGETGALTLGFSDMPNARDLASLLMATTDNRRRVTVSVVEESPGDLVTRLHDETLDAIFVHDADSSAGLSSVSVREDAVLVAMPSTHRLAARASIEWADVVDEPLLVTHEDAASGRDRALVRSIFGTEADPMLRPQQVPRCALPLLAGAGLGLALVCSTAFGARDPQIVYRPASRAGAPARLLLQCRWNATNRNPILQAMLTALLPRAAALPAHSPSPPEPP